MSIDMPTTIPDGTVLFGFVIKSQEGMKVSAGMPHNGGADAAQVAYFAALLANSLKTATLQTLEKMDHSEEQARAIYEAAQTIVEKQRPTDSRYQAKTKEKED